MRRLLRPSFWPLVVALAALPALAAAPQKDAGQAPKIDWVDGPTTAKLGDVATIEVPEGFRFTGAQGTKTLMEMMQNPVAGNELGTLVAKVKEGENPWFVVFEFDDIGYVKDDQKSDLDADKLLADIRKGNAEGNEERKKRGWEPLTLDGWKIKPFYNDKTHNLEWALLFSSSDGKTVNYSTRILGRRGVMSVDLVLDPNQLDAVQGTYQGLLTNFHFDQGQRYAEFRKGDKIAEYGLAALIAGGAAAVALKTGLFAKFWKLILVAIAGIGGALKKFWTKLTRRNEDTIPRPDATT